MGRKNHKGVTTGDKSAVGGQKHRAIYTKVEEELICNICLVGQAAELTLDHVPPKATLAAVDRLNPTRAAPLKVRSMFGQPHQPWAFSQSGIRFKTLCGPCNNNLGSEFDGELAVLSRQARALLRARGWLYAPQVADCDPDKVVRSIFGHMLAAKDHTPRTDVDEDMRVYLRDTSMFQPPGLFVYYWAHPDANIRMFRDTVILEAHQKVTVCSLLAWQSLGFLVSRSPDYRFPLMNDYLGQATKPVRVSLFAPSPGAIDAWLNRTPKAGGAPLSTALQALHH